MTDVLIIGSGPAGMTAGIYIKRANLDVQIIEKVDILTKSAMIISG